MLVLGQLDIIFDIFENFGMVRCSLSCTFRSTAGVLSIPWILHAVMHSFCGIRVVASDYTTHSDRLHVKKMDNRHQILHRRRDAADSRNQPPRLCVRGFKIPPQAPCCAGHGLRRHSGTLDPRDALLSCFDPAVEVLMLILLVYHGLGRSLR